MPSFCVTHEAIAVVTVHATTDSVAVREARKSLAAAVEATDLPSGTDVRLHDGEIDEHPVAPFDPYEIAVPVEVSVTVEADDEPTARAEAREACAALLDRLDVRWDVEGDPLVVPA